ncbi:FAD-dependent monooxygenase [Microbacterium sp. LRZ72]|uniref:FAD-dependent oxidoreductase n=1 Tax=Microbacterium sp. LRZ72 TaxID=2942481 RepID=UPI0029BC7CD3|nr:NAD(P)/FAD-dependent oxidoreductase [Microbacterium sp. LRZ72]MDX2377955.1 FAD-dependent monooxygenase [Microbacterium sp. LRZ72]
MHDVLIVGAGPVATLLAAELARRGVDAALYERRLEPSPGTRAVGVHAAALTAMEASGATERILSSALRVGRGEARVGGASIGVLRFDSIGRHPYVATLPQQGTERALSDAAQAWGAPEPRRGFDVSRVRSRRGTAEVTARVGDDSVDLRARIVVVATGARGRGVSPLTADVRARTYPDRYVMSDAPDATGDGATAVVHLHGDGVLESFPLPGGRRRFVAWDGDASRRLAGATDLAERLRDAIRTRTGSVDAADAVTAASAFGVRRALVRRMWHDRVLAIGDAAHEVSPIGGQGMNLGLLDAVTLAPLLAEWTRAGEPPEADLTRWERRRRRAAAGSARLAVVNTVIGRPAPPWGQRSRAAVLHGVLRSPAAPLLARAYAMGFDPDA